MANLFVGPDDDRDRYRVERPVGQGGEGTVFRCEEVASRSTVAVKLLALDHDVRREDVARRWRAQCDLRQGVSWPGVVALRECFEGYLPHPSGDGIGRGLFLVMDWVEGRNLESVVRSRRGKADSLNQLLDELMPVASALDHMHSGRQTGGVPVAHGDVKPSNVIVTKYDGGMLVDLGMLTQCDSGKAARGGTRGYMAPEVAETGVTSPAADRFGFAGILYFVLTGRHPPHPIDVEEVRDQILGLGALDGRSELIERLVAAMSPDPARRPTRLATWLPEFAVRPLRKRRRSVVAVTLLVPAAILALMVGGRAVNDTSSPSDPCRTVEIVSPEANAIVAAGLVRVVWEPASCEPMVFQWYQYDRPEPGVDDHDTRSGDSFQLPEPKAPEERAVRTELKIWVPGAATPADSVFIWVTRPSLAG